MAKKNIPTNTQKTVEENQKTISKNKKQTTKKVIKPKRSKAKETVSELKKVNWPSFGKVVKNTGMVLAVVLIFGLVVFGIDSLISWLISLIMKI